MVHVVYLIFLFLLDTPFSHNGDIVWSWCGGGEATLQNFGKKKPKKIFYVILGSGIILNNFWALGLNIRLYMSTVYAVDVDPKSIISYPNSNPDGSF